MKEMLRPYSEVIFIALMSVISTCFSNGKNSEHKTYSKADYVRGTKLLFRSHLHSPHNSNQHLFFYFKDECERETKLLFRSYLHSPHNSDQHLFFFLRVKTASIQETV
jgi:hypothetical protein